MFEKVSRIAERAATSASRRQFLGRIGTGAMATAAACAGLLVHAAPAWAGRGCKGSIIYCHYIGGRREYKNGGKCLKKLRRKGRFGWEVWHLDYQTECTSYQDCLDGKCV